MKVMLKIGIWKEKGIYYYNNGNRAMGDFLNGKEIGIHVILTSDGNIKEIAY